MRRFGNENMSDTWFDIKRDIERLAETLDDFNTQDADTFSAVESMKAQVKGIKKAAVDKLIECLENENK